MRGTYRSLLHTPHQTRLQLGGVHEGPVVWHEHVNTRHLAFCCCTTLFAWSCSCPWTNTHDLHTYYLTGAVLAVSQGLLHAT